MSEWNKLFDILQVLNPQSDEYYKGGELPAEEQWDDICHYMDILKQDRVSADEDISSMIRLLRDIHDGNTDTPKEDIRKELMKYGIDLIYNESIKKEE
jgi:hypothetical protein